MLIPVAELRAEAPTERAFDVAELGEHTLLAIDTALGTSVALGHRGRVYEVSSDDSRGHAEVIGGLLARVFELARVTAESLTGVVAGIGPGPFTGLRVGLAAAYASAVGRGVPLLPLQGHDAVALAMLECEPVHRLRVVQDARRRELFVTDYEGYTWASLPQQIAEPRLERRDDFVGEADDAWPERIPAGRLVQVAARRLVSAIPFEEDRALYLRAPDVKPAAAVKRVSVPGERFVAAGSERTDPPAASGMPS